MEKRRFASRSDFIPVIIIIVLAVGAYFLFTCGQSGNYAEILADNTVIKRVDLSQDSEFSLEGYEGVTFSVKDGAISFVSSDCPDKICVRTGYIKNRGQSAVCLPNRLTVRIVGSESDIDVYVG